MKKSLAYNIFNTMQPVKMLAGVMLLSGVLPIQSATTVQADEIDLAAVTSSISAALKEVAAESRIDNEYVLPLRTNAELADISAMCEFVLSMPDVDLSTVPSICGPAESPVEIQVPFAGTLGTEFGYQFTRYVSDDDHADIPSFLLVGDSALEHYFTGG